MVLSKQSAALLFHSSTSRPPPNPLVALREISPTLGRGWFAVQDLPAGTILWKESPRAVATSRLDLIQLVDENLKDFQHLCYYHNNDNDSRKEQMGSSLCCGRTARIKQQSTIAESIVRCNHFEYSHEQFLLFDDISMLNHSCNPNASVMIHSTNKDETFPNQVIVDQDNRSLPYNTETAIQALVKTGRTIAAGEEITISYSDEALFWQKQERHEFLHSRWGFFCECERCRYPVDQNKDNILLAHVWPLLEQAAAISAESKPRSKSVDPACLRLQQKAAEAVAEYLPHLQQCRRFQADAEYFK